MRNLVSGTARIIRVLIVDDHPVLRRGLADLLGELPDMTVCAQAGTVAEAMAAAARERPDVAVIDLTLGHESGFDLLERLTTSAPEVRVLVLSAHDEWLFAERALKAGAYGYLMKDHSPTDLVAAVRQVATGKTYVSAEVRERILSSLGASNRGHDVRSPLERLSGREHQVLTLLGQGFSTREIAQSLGLSVKTIESHLAHLKEKLGANNGRELARMAVSWTGALPPIPTRRD